MRGLFWLSAWLGLVFRTLREAEDAFTSVHNFYINLKCKVLQRDDCKEERGWGGVEEGRGKCKLKGSSTLRIICSMSRRGKLK